MAWPRHHRTHERDLVDLSATRASFRPDRACLGKFHISLRTTRRMPPSQRSYVRREGPDRHMKLNSAVVSDPDHAIVNTARSWMDAAMRCQRRSRSVLRRLFVFGRPRECLRVIAGLVLARHLPAQQCPNQTGHVLLAGVILQMSGQSFGCQDPPCPLRLQVIEVQLPVGVSMSSVKCAS